MVLLENGSNEMSERDYNVMKELFTTSMAVVKYYLHINELERFTHTKTWSMPH